MDPKPTRKLTNGLEGYSYAEIGELTGWTYTKVNRCLAEGRQRFKAVLNSIEEGHRCDELAPTLSAFVDGEASSRLTAQLLTHLSECSHCRAKMRAYRTAPRAAAALAPALPAARSLTERLHDLVGGAQSRLPGRTGATETAVSQLTAAGGTRGSGMALAAKILTACVGTAGGAAACVAAGVVPPVHVGSHGGSGFERVADDSAAHTSNEAAQTVADPAPQPLPDAASEPAPASPPPPPLAPPSPTPQVTTEFSPEISAPSTASRASSAGEFGATPSAGGGSGGAGGGGGEFGP